MWLLGFPDQALDTAREALTMVQELDFPPRMAHARISSALIHIFRRESQEALKQADDAIALSTEHELPQWLALGTACRGWAIVDQC